MVQNQNQGDDDKNWVRREKDYATYTPSYMHIVNDEKNPKKKKKPKNDMKMIKIDFYGFFLVLCRCVSEWKSQKDQGQCKKEKTMTQ